MISMLIRADASSRIGSGHLMRCLALAQGWQAHGGSATFLSYCESDALRHHIESARIRFIPLEKAHPEPLDLQTTLLTLQQLTTSWLVLDGYHFDPTYQQAIREAGYQLMVIDDMAHLPYYHADVLLNQNTNAEELTYRCDPDAALLLGNNYALLRPEFLAWRSWQRQIPDVARKVLVTLGGGDSDNVTLKVIQALQQLDIPDLEARIMVGPANTHLKTLREAVQCSACNLQLLTAITGMPGQMAWADVAISAGGSTCWELAFMGLPNVVLVLAENQKDIAEGLDEVGVAINLGRHEQLSIEYIGETIAGLLESPDRRCQMSRLGGALVDGNGANRVVEELGRVCKVALTRLSERAGSRSGAGPW